MIETIVDWNHTSASVDWSEVRMFVLTIRGCGVDTVTSGQMGADSLCAHRGVSDILLTLTIAITDSASIQLQP